MLHVVDVVGVGVEVVVVTVVELRIVIRDDMEVENVDLLLFCIVYFYK